MAGRTSSHWPILWRIALYFDFETLLFLAGFDSVQEVWGLCRQQENRGFPVSRKSPIFRPCRANALLAKMCNIVLTREYSVTSKPLVYNIYKKKWKFKVQGFLS